MKKIWFVIIPLVMICTGCGQNKADHKAVAAMASSEAETAAAQTGEDQTLMMALAEASACTSADAVSEDNKDAYDVYPYDIKADRKSFDVGKKPDIAVGDKLYMTQINDWYMNFSDYKGKTVEIEGYYLDFGDGYRFIGRKGPTCPYCTGGYVDFEFVTDEDTSKYVSADTWIAVTGILRQGEYHPGKGKAAEPFYYIEAMKVEKMAEQGVTTISD